MKITLEQHGGLAAGIRRRPRAVESSGLAPEAAAALARLVTEAKAAPAPGGGAVRRAPDAMSHTITVEEDGQQPVVLRQSDAGMSDAFAALLEWIEEHAEAG